MQSGSSSPVVKAAPGGPKGRVRSEARSCPVVLLTCDMDQREGTPTLSARFYRRKAAEARRSAEAVTTRAIRQRLHNLARDFDRLADAADRAEQTSDPLRLSTVLCATWRFFIISNHSGKRSFCRAELRSLEDPGARTRAVVHRNRKFADSPQERRVKSEPVPEVRFSGAGNSGLDSKTFMDDTGSAKAPFRGRISRNFDLVPRPTPPAMSS